VSRGPVVGAVLCGGQSRRFGSDKALADAGGIPLGTRVVNAMRDAGIDPIVAVGGTAGPALGIVTIADRHPGEGPLAALATVLRWAGTGKVLVAPCDLPLITANDFAAIVGAGDEGETVVACSADRIQPSVACWPAERANDIAKLVSDGHRRWVKALDCGPWVSVKVADEALYDADTPQRLKALLAMDPANDSSLQRKARPARNYIVS